MYRERSSSLPGAVIWTRTVAEAGATHRILPDGCLDLIWLDGALLVAGPDTRVHLATSEPGAWCVGLRFAPGTASAVLGVPAFPLRDRRVPLADLWPAGRVRRLTDRLAAARRPGVVLEDEAAAAAGISATGARTSPWAGTAPGVGIRTSGGEPVAGAIVVRLRAGLSVAATAEAVGLSARQLHRRCLDLFGYGPKTLARVLRMQHAVRLARADHPFATVAIAAGYADQAHLSREVKALTGVRLSELTR
jgi:AraC-like DNA-binding protein